MQNDLAVSYPDLDIQILGVNEMGHEPGNGSVTAGRDIPWLQDVDADHDRRSDLWTSWDVTYRDVVILDTTNTRVGVFNVTSQSLQVPDNYNTLRQMLIDAAPIPEPSTLALLSMATLALLAHAWRKRCCH